MTYPIAGVLIRNFSKSTFYWIMAAISLVGSLFFLLLSDPEKVEDPIDQPGPIQAELEMQNTTEEIRTESAIISKEKKQVDEEVNGLNQPGK